MKKRLFAMPKLMVALVMSVGVCGLMANDARAESSTWLSPGAPSLEMSHDRSPVPRSDYNTDCTPETGVIRPAGLVPPNLMPYSEQTTEGCAVRSASGKFLNGFFKLNGSNLYASLSEPLRPIPNSEKAVRYSGGTSQVSNLFIVPEFAQLLSPMHLADGKLRYDIKPYISHGIRDQRGSLLDIDHNSISYSASGEWLIASAFQGFVRFNLVTNELLLFDQPLNYQSGISPAVQSAITNDGRFAVIASGPHTRFRVFDLTTCNRVNSPTIGRKTCDFHDYYGSLPAKTGTYVGLHEVRFISDRTLAFYRQEQFANRQSNDRYFITAPGQQITTFQYLGLGDSYTSGLGAYRYRPGTDTEQNQCRNSEVSYPYLIKQQLGYSASESVACAGATLRDISSSSFEYPGQVGDAVHLKDRQLAPILQSFNPGYIPQDTFVSNYLPNTVTVSIGGNDIGFADKLMTCLKPGTCFSTYEDRLEIVREINSKLTDVTEVFSKVRSHARLTSRVYALGYPEIANADGSCGLNVRLDSAEIQFSNELIGHLNNMINQAAIRAGINYIDVTQAFHGHRLCETSYSDIAVNGLTAGNDKLTWWLIKGPIGGESYHPNALGHRLYQVAILSQSNSFADSQSTNRTSTRPSSPNSSLLDVPKSNRSTNILHHKPGMSPNLIYRGKNVAIDIRGGDFGLKPGTSYRLAISGQSATTNATSDVSGNIASSLSINSTLDTGFTSLHVFGKNLAGEDLDIYKTVYVSASSDDYDGDSIANPNDSCPLNSGASPDQDQDGVGDECDGELGAPPLQAAATEIAANSRTLQTTVTHPSLQPAADPMQSARSLESLSIAGASPSAVLATTTLAPHNSDLQPSISRPPSESKRVWLILAIALVIAAAIYTRHRLRNPKKVRQRR